MSVKSEGLGLGLQIVRGIVESHGARLHFVRNMTRGLSAVIDIDTDVKAAHKTDTGTPAEAADGTDHRHPNARETCN